MLDGLRLALKTLTVIPVRGPRALDRRTAGRAMELAPLVGLLLGLTAATVLYGFRQVSDARELLPSVLAITTLVLISRGMHLAGLANLVDGLGSLRDPERTRAAMKAPYLGPMGGVVLVLVLLTQVTALATCVQEGRGTASVLLAVVVGRLAVTGACRDTRPATPEGLGALVAGTVRRGVTSGWVLLVAVGFTAYATVDKDTDGGDPEHVVRTLLAVALGLGAARLLRQHATRRVGGLTGDVLGGLSETATTVCLVVLASAL